MKHVEKKVINNDEYSYIKGTDILHCEDGPAVIYVGGGKEWHVEGKLHREDGPAIVHDHADVFGDENEWYLNGKRVSSNDEYMVSTGLSEESMAKLIEQYGDIK